MAQIQHPEPLWTSLRRAPDDARPPAPLVLGLLLTALLCWVGVAGMLALPTAVVVGGAVVLAAVAAWWQTVPAALCTASVTFLVVDGFVLSSLGDLHWDGLPDAALLLVLLLVCLVSPEARREHTEARTVRAERAHQGGVRNGADAVSDS